MTERPANTSTSRTGFQGRRRVEAERIASGPNRAPGRPRPLRPQERLAGAHRQLAPRRRRGEGLVLPGTGQVELLHSSSQGIDQTRTLSRRSLAHAEDGDHHVLPEQLEVDVAEL